MPVTGLFKVARWESGSALAALYGPTRVRSHRTGEYLVTIVQGSVMFMRALKNHDASAATLLERFGRPLGIATPGADGPTIRTSENLFDVL